MWDEIIKLRKNSYFLAKRAKDDYYSIIDNNYNVISDENVKRWFSNGYILCEKKVFYEYYGRDRYHVNDIYTYKVIDNKLEIIYQVTTRYYDLFDNTEDYMFGYLPVREHNNGFGYGAIDETGDLVIELSYPLKEVNKRILMLGYMSDQLLDEKQKQRAVIDLHCFVSLVDYGEFIKIVHALIEKNYNFYEILFHIILYRDSNFKNGRNYHPDDPLDYSDLTVQFTTNYMLELLHEKFKTPIPRKLHVFASCNSNGKGESFYYENKIITSYPLNIKYSEQLNENIEEIKKQIKELCSSLPAVNFEEQIFNKVSTKLKEKIESANPLVEGRIAKVVNYLTLESGYTKFSNLGRYGLIYNREVQFFDSLKFGNIHLLEGKGTREQYYAQTDSISLDFYGCTYKEFCELLDIYYLIR